MKKQEQIFDKKIYTEILKYGISQGHDTTIVNEAILENIFCNNGKFSVRVKNYMYEASVRLSSIKPVKNEVKVFEPSQEDFFIYELIKKIRMDSFKCDCGSVEVSQYRSTTIGSASQLRCKKCQRTVSIRHNTYIHHASLTFGKVYRIIVILVQDPSYPSTQLAKAVGITQHTAWKYSHLIKSVIHTLEKRNVKCVLEKILQDKKNDKNPIVPVKTGILKYTHEDILNMRRLYDERIDSISGIARIYGEDPSNMRKIVKRMMYKSFI